MTLQRDPEHNEARALQRLVDFTRRRVLEVGCGEGRMTWLYAGACAHTAALDPDLDALRILSVDRPLTLQDRVSPAAARAEQLPFPHEKFDIAVLAWSL